MAARCSHLPRARAKWLTSPPLAGGSGLTSLCEVGPYLLAGSALGCDEAWGSVYAWDVRTRQLVRVLEGHTAAVTSLCALSATLAASGSADATVRVWDLAAAGSAAAAVLAAQAPVHAACARSLTPPPLTSWRA